MHDRFIRFELDYPNKVDKNVTVSKILKTLNEIKEISPLFENWYSTDRPKKGKGYEKIEPNTEYLLVRYDKALVRDKDSKVINYPCGIGDAFKNTANYERSFVLSFSLDITSELFKNNIVFIFPDNISEEYQYIVSEDYIKRIIALFTKIWNPNNIVVNI